jgi:hypothetical protein
MLILIRRREVNNVLRDSGEAPSIQITNILNILILKKFFLINELLWLFCIIFQSRSEKFILSFQKIQIFQKMI